MQRLLKENHKVSTAILTNNHSFVLPFYCTEVEQGKMIVYTRALPQLQSIFKILDMIPLKLKESFSKEKLQRLEKVSFFVL